MSHSYDFQICGMADHPASRCVSDPFGIKIRSHHSHTNCWDEMLTGYSGNTCLDASYTDYSSCGYRCTFDQGLCEVNAAWLFCPEKLARNDVVPKGQITCFSCCSCFVLKLYKNQFFIFFPLLSRRDASSTINNNWYSITLNIEHYWTVQSFGGPS